MTLSAVPCVDACKKKRSPQIGDTRTHGFDTKNAEHVEPQIVACALPLHTSSISFLTFVAPGIKNQEAYGDQEAKSAVSSRSGKQKSSETVVARVSACLRFL